jgi:hypothetical protein
MARDQIFVRHGKGGKDRIVMLPRSLRPDLERQLAWRRQLQDRDLKAKLARVALPDDGLDRASPIKATTVLSS